MNYKLLGKALAIVFAWAGVFAIAMFLLLFGFYSMGADFLIVLTILGILTACVYEVYQHLVRQERYK